MSDLAERLLNAHVEHEVGRLRGVALAGIVETNVAAAFQWMEDVKFDDVVTRAQIVGIIDRYVIELKVSGGITELAGEMSRVVFSSTASATTRVGDILPGRSYEDFADKIGTLGGISGELIGQVTRSAAFGPLASRVVSRVTTDFIFRRGAGTDSSSALTELLGTLAERLLPGLEERVANALSRYLEPKASLLTADRGVRALKAVEPEWVRQIADEIWDDISRRPLSDAGSLFSAQDLEDFVVLGYEFWQKFRKTRYFRAVSAEVVDRLFEKYGKESVLSVIADMGITEAMVTAELKLFLGPLLEHAYSTGFLEQQVRAYLEPFYRSPALAALLSAP